MVRSAFMYSSLSGPLRLAVSVIAVELLQPTPGTRVSNDSARDSHLLSRTLGRGFGATTGKRQPNYDELCIAKNSRSYIGHWFPLGSYCIDIFQFAIFCETHNVTWREEKPWNCEEDEWCQSQDFYGIAYEYDYHRPRLHLDAWCVKKEKEVAQIKTAATKEHGDTVMAGTYPVPIAAYRVESATTIIGLVEDDPYTFEYRYGERGQPWERMAVAGIKEVPIKANVTDPKHYQISYDVSNLRVRNLVFDGKVNFPQGHAKRLIIDTVWGSSTKPS